MTSPAILLTPETRPPVGTPVVLVRDTTYGAWVGAEGVVRDYETRRVASVLWTTGEHAGAHQAVRIDRLAVRHPVG